MIVIVNCNCKLRLHHHRQNSSQLIRLDNKTNMQRTFFCLPHIEKWKKPPLTSQTAICLIGHLASFHSESSKTIWPSSLHAKIEYLQCEFNILTEMGFFYIIIKIIIRILHSLALETTEEVNESGEENVFFDSGIWEAHHSAMVAHWVSPLSSALYTHTETATYNAYSAHMLITHLHRPPTELRAPSLSLSQSHIHTTLRIVIV